jgi:hypothetical protein
MRSLHVTLPVGVWVCGIGVESGAWITRSEAFCFPELRVFISFLIF